MNCIESMNRNIYCVIFENYDPVLQAYISDEGYDVDMFFEIEGHKGQIFSDVDNDRDEMVNYLLINDECVAKCIQKAHQSHVVKKKTILTYLRHFID